MLSRIKLTPVFGALVLTVAFFWLCYYLSLLSLLIKLFLWFAIIVATAVAFLTIMAKVRREPTENSDRVSRSERMRLAASLGVIFVAVVILAKFPADDSTATGTEAERFVIKMDDLGDVSQEPLISLSLEKAQHAADSDDFELAEIYILNALQRSNYRFEILQSYFDLVLFLADEQIKNQSGVDVDAIDRGSTFLGSALLSANPADIERIKGLLTALELKREEIFSANLPEQPIQSLTDRWQKLVETGQRMLSELPQDLNTESKRVIESHVRDMQLLLEEADESLDPNYFLQMEKEVDYWQDLMQIVDVITYTNSCLDNLNAFPDGSNAQAVVLQAVEGIQSSLWRHDVAAYPKILQRKINDNINKIQEAIKAAQYNRSIPAIEVITDKYNAVLDLVGESLAPQEKYESRCKAIQQNLLQSQVAYQGIQSEKARKEVDFKIKNMADALVLEREKQIARYQVFVLEKCERAMKRIGKEWVVGAHDAEKIFNDFTLYNVDLTKLKPETSQCYQRVVSKFMAELPNHRKIVVERKMIVEPKMKLEEF